MTRMNPSARADGTDIAFGFPKVERVFGYLRLWGNVIIFAELMVIDSFGGKAHSMLNAPHLA